MAAGIVIVGAGECGARAALGLRDLGFAGEIALLGQEPHPPYERPPLSKSVIHSAEDPTPKWIAAAHTWEAKSIRVLTSTKVVAIDRKSRQVALEDGGRIAYDRLLLATGARARRLTLQGGDDPRIHYLRDFEQALRLRRALSPGALVAVVGGGFIGLEIAAGATARGCRVAVIEALPRLLSRGVPEDIAAAIAERHRRAGVDLLLGTGIALFEVDGSRLGVQLSDGRTIAADLAIVGIGALPNQELAAEAGLAIDNGIAVDAGLRTSDPDIFAAGDCCSFPLDLYGGRRVRLESWRNALDQGELAARALMGESFVHASCPWFWSDQFDLTLQVAGLPDPALKATRRDQGDGAFIIFQQDGDGRLLAASGIGKTGALARDIRLAQMLIAKRAKLDPVQLADPARPLKSMLSAA